MGGRMGRGDVRWYTFRAPDKRRPVLVLTQNSAIAFLNEVTVAPITSTVRGVPSEVALDESDGLPGRCAVNLYHLQTVPKGRLGARITVLSPDRLAEVRDALLFALGF